MDTLRKTAVIALAFWLAGIGTIAWADGGDTTLIHACVSNANGGVRIVGPTETCRAGETPLHWSATAGDGAQSRIRFLAFLSGTNVIATTAPVIFEDFPGMSASFQTTAAGCITATFSFHQGDSKIYFSILLDNQPMEGQTVAVFTDYPFFKEVPDAILSNGTGEANSYAVWKCNVNSGIHTVTVQWKAFDPQYTNVLIGGRTLVVQGP